MLTASDIFTTNLQDQKDKNEELVFLTAFRSEN